MPLIITCNDIAKMNVDAVVIAANVSSGGGADSAVHRTAGHGFYSKYRPLRKRKAGKSQITGSYGLHCKYVIHTICPIWRYGNSAEREALYSCYRTSLASAKRYGCETVAFPLIVPKAADFPMEQALRMATDAITRFLKHSDITVYLVIYDRSAYRIDAGLLSDVSEYIDGHYMDMQLEFELLSHEASLFSCDSINAGAPIIDDIADSEPCLYKRAAPVTRSRELEELLAYLDEGFSETLLKLIDRSGKKDSEIYKRANVDRKLFSKIRNNPNYKPSKPTAIAFAIALELDLDETRDFIARAGYALSNSSKFDIIIEYFIEHKLYDIFMINETLFAFDQSLLGT